MDAAHTRFNEGVTLYEKGDYQRAIAAFDKAIALDPTLAEVWNNRGLALIQTEQYQEALKSINKALSLHPGYDNAKKARKIVLDLINEPENAGAAPEPAGAPLTDASAVPDEAGKKPSKLFVAAVLVFMVVAVCGIVVVKGMHESGGPLLPVFSTPTTIPTAGPTTIPIPTSTPVPTPTLPVIPPSGVWVEINYDQFYSGSVGTPGSQQQLTGAQQVMQNTGDHFYRILTVNHGLVTASVQKNDGSGDKLTVKIYKDGTLIETDSTTLPYGTLDVTAVIPASVATPAADNSTETGTVPAAAGA
jgi:hypothetical protein